MLWWILLALLRQGHDALNWSYLMQPIIYQIGIARKNICAWKYLVNVLPCKRTCAWGASYLGCCVLVCTSSRTWMVWTNAGLGWICMPITSALTRSTWGASILNVEAESGALNWYALMQHKICQSEVAGKKICLEMVNGYVYQMWCYCKSTCLRSFLIGMLSLSLH